MRVRDIMSSPARTVTLEDDIITAAKAMSKDSIGILPVVDVGGSGRIRGVITDRDITTRHVAAGHVGICAVREHMTRTGLTVVHPDAEIHEALGTMRRQRIRRLPVVDEHHGVVGILSLADIAINYDRLESDTLELALEGICTPIRLAPDAVTP